MPLRHETFRVGPPPLLFCLQQTFLSTYIEFNCDRIHKTDKTFSEINEIEYEVLCITHPSPPYPDKDFEN